MARLRRSRLCRLGMECLEDRATPALFTVTSLADSGNTSLRGMVAAANASPGSDVIRFIIPTTTPTPGPLTITLTSGEIAITDSLTILGSNSNTGTTPPTNASPMINVSGNQSSRIFNINGQGTLFVNVNGLGLLNGKTTASGGAVLNVGEYVSFNSCTFSGNGAAGNGGAIESVATALSGTTNAAATNVTLNHSRLFGNHATDGGAVHFTGPGALTANFSTFDKNSSAQEGGAISFATGGRFNIESSTLSNNAAGTSGGGIHFVGGAGGSNTPGGGTVASAPQMMIRNSTVSGNDAKFTGGGVALASFPSGVLVVANSTVTSNAAGENSSTVASAGGGIYVGGTATSTTVGLVSLVSSVLSKNFATVGPDASTPGKLSAGFSAVGSSGGIATFVNGGNNLAFGVDVKLAALANNGGPTQTHMPAADSPLVNHGSNPYALRSDQRGGAFNRVVGLHADIGAVERAATITPNPNPGPSPAPINGIAVPEEDGTNSMGWLLL